MTLYLPDHLPAARTLREEGVEIGRNPGPGALRIGLVNLMPDAEATERQFARMLAGAEEVSVSLHLPAPRRSRQADAAHLGRFYSVLKPGDLSRLDGLIVTGAPVDRLPLESADYWTELVALFDHARARRLPLLAVGRAGQAMLGLYHRIEARMLPRKALGLHLQETIAPTSPMAAGLGHAFLMPVSRNSTVPAAAILCNPRLTLIASSRATGPAIVEDRAARAVAALNHFEYEADTMEREYARDRARGIDVAPPAGGPQDAAFWATTGRRFYANWLGLARRARADAGGRDAAGAHSIAA